ncbi:hypothetical protein [Actinomadura macrotermitis]|uniref:Uncharacterized protein n=1 Tax=Actinomadura macrotermitis TaxID=2585200 RepID=A0A7K0C144_9ACTN|nr:hypothetical protein [Actinomadura macrotermitis]MQY07181.1 hypothetical protein [Actinomadura macrotermitis]
MKNDELDRVIDGLKPALVAELADAAYARRPELAQIQARASTVQRRRPVRLLALAAGATAVAAALAVNALPSNPRQNGTIDTRTFLLSSAETAAKQPATHGTCWYSRTRMWQDLMPFKAGPGLPTPAGKRRTFQAQTASSAENWVCTRSGGTGMRFRMHGPLDITATFPTKKDEAAWKAAGSPPLDINGGTTASKPATITYDKPTGKEYKYKASHLVNPSIGSHEIEWTTIATLPATKSGLEGYLRKLWQQDRKGGANGYVAPADFGRYVFVSAWDLFMAPTTPGTRAALYRILADSPSVHVTGQIKDRLGRTGMAVTAQGVDGVRLVVDPATARFLAFEQLSSDPDPQTGRGPQVGDYYAFERQGWVNKIGAVPTP